MDAANIHASSVMLAQGAPFPYGLRDMGILLLGDSGAGKSDLALRLIAQGCLLVSDDRTELFVEGGKLKARAPASLAGLIELRGLGIVELPFAKSVAVSLVVELVARDAVARLPDKAFYTPPAPLALPDAARPPLIRQHAFDASAAAKLRWAVYAFAQNLFRDRAHP